MNREVVEIRINEKGGFTFEAKEGFSGASCVERTKELEIALGGRTPASTKKKDEYYNPDSSPVTVNLK